MKRKIKEFNFIERIRKQGVKTDNTPAIIGVDLVILEFKEFIKRLKEAFYPDIKGPLPTKFVINTIDKLARDKLI